MEKFTQEAGSLIVDRLILAIQENKQYLSDIDGAIGDGDHGINMNKGFTLCREALDKQPGGFSYGLKTLGKILMMKMPHMIVSTTRPAKNSGPRIFMTLLVRCT